MAALLKSMLRCDRLPDAWRAAALCAICGLLGIGLMVGVGPIVRIDLVAMSIVAVLLFGLATAALATVDTARRDAVANGAELDRKRALLRTLIDTLPDLVFTKDTDGRFLECNPATLALFGVADESALVGKSVFDLFPAEVAQPYDDDDRAVFAGRAVLDREERSIDSAGRTIWYLTNKVPLRDERGAVVGLIGICHDVTARKQLEAQLRQSQKMDAVGQLAGGVAHDFNNLLSVILSYSDLLLEDLPDDAMREELQEIRNAGARAAELTRQLLLFSRQQVLQPQALDLGAVMAGMDKMLQRLLGEDIELASVQAPDLWRVRADPGSVEQVIVNLVVNARDAMPVGGQLTMRTANVTLDDRFTQTHLGAVPGDYVMLSVADTGCGMDKATQARIFEPFFTTKERGKGTGLGLSTVFGIVQQNGGTVWVYSEPTLGTTFKVYLPRVEAEGAAADAPRVPAEAPRGAETVLLVEDEKPVRDAARSILQRHGYRVLEAGDAAQALRISREHAEPIELLLTDVVMPGMSGPALATELMPERPGMKVLCMSGYTDDVAYRHGYVEAGFTHLQKPLTIDALTRAVRGVLDAPAAGASR